MDGFEYSFHEFHGKIVFTGFVCDPGENVFPAVGLEYGNVVLFFVITDFFNDLHSMSQGFHDGVVEGIDFLSKFLDN